MSPVTSTPTTYYNNFSTTLKRSMTTASQTTGIVLNPIFDNNGVKITFSSIPLLLTFIQGTKIELISAGGFTQDASGNFTLTDVTRDLPRDGSSLTGQGNPNRFISNATVFSGMPAQILNNLPFLSSNNTFTGTNTFNEQTIFIDGIKNNPFADTAARDAAIPSPANGMVCYVTGVGLQFYSGGSWNTVGSATVNNASTTVSGIIEISTSSERGAGTATGGTGAALVVGNDALVKTSSGAGDENKIAVLGASGKFAPGFLSDITGDGSDGALNVTSGTTTIDCAGAQIVTKNYSSINISSGATLTVSNKAAEGVLLILKCLGNCTIDGTINLSSMGSNGAASTVVVNGTATPFSSNGSSGTNAVNNAGQSRNGILGQASTSGAASNSAGGGGGASTINNGITASTAGSAPGGTGGTALTAAIAYLWSQGITVSPGAGGGSGGVSCAQGGGTGGATSGSGGTGGGGLVIIVGGDYDDSGSTINLSASDGGNATITSRVGSISVNAGGGGGGGAGSGLVLVKGSIVSTGTKILTSGTGGTAAHDTFSGTHYETAGGAGGAGVFTILPFIT